MKTDRDAQDEKGDGRENVPIDEPFAFAGCYRRDKRKRDLKEGCGPSPTRAIDEPMGDILPDGPIEHAHVDGHA